MDHDRGEARLDDGWAKHRLARTQIFQVIARRLDAAGVAKRHRSPPHGRGARQCLYAAGIGKIGNFGAADRAPSDDLDLVIVVGKSEQFEMAGVEILHQLPDVVLAGKTAAAERNFDLPDLAWIAALDGMVDLASHPIGEARGRARLRLLLQSCE